MLDKKLFKKEEDMLVYILNKLVAPRVKNLEKLQTYLNEISPNKQEHNLEKYTAFNELLDMK